MNNFDKIIITGIEHPFIVHSKKDRIYKMNDRPSYGLSLCMSGQITYTMCGKEYVSNENNAVLLPKHGTYSLYGDKDGLFPVINFQCENFDLDEIKLFNLDNPKSCLKSFEVLKNMYLNNENNLKIFSAFYELLNRIHNSTSNSDTPLSEIIKYIGDNINNPSISNSTLANQMEISEVYLRKLFRFYLNKSPRQYILHLRIKKAKQLLCDTSLSVSQISEECGFSSVYHFCRIFKQRTGQTPTQYAINNKIFKI